MNTTLDILIPTRNRPVELATTLAGLAAQDVPFTVIVSDQSDNTPSYRAPAAATMLRVLHHQGHHVHTAIHLPRRGMAEHRSHLLAQSTATYVLFLDDDVWLAPGTVQRLLTAITDLDCGLVGAAPQGLSYADDERPHELEPYQEWPGKPEPEHITPDTPAWHRWTLHNAANPLHLATRLGLTPTDRRAYKIAWIGGCTLYNRTTLVTTGGFDFWPDLPPDHAGEDVLAQWRVMAATGGAGILPSGAVHLESPTTVPNREADATRLIRP